MFGKRTRTNIDMGGTYTEKALRNQYPEAESKLIQEKIVPV